MDSVLWEKYWEKWVDKELANSKKEKRNYLHFDPKIVLLKNTGKANSTSRLSSQTTTATAQDIRQQFATQLSKKFKHFLTDSNNVASRGFYPFIKSVFKTPRYKWDDDKKRRVLTLKERPICYASHFDSYIYSWYSNLLTELYEEKFKDETFCTSVTAYRSLDKKNNVHFAKEVFDFISTKGECVALAFDVKSFFDTIDHELLKLNWKSLLGKDKLPADHFNIYKSLTRYQFVQKEFLQDLFDYKLKFGGNIRRISSLKEFKEMVKGIKIIESNNSPFGIPQGSPMSAVLSNIYMIEFDKNVYSELDKVRGLYKRYSDDIIIVCEVSQAEHMRKVVESELSKCKLASNDKTETVYFKVDHKGDLRGYREDGKYTSLQYLGFEFNGTNVYVRSSSMSRYHRRIKTGVKRVIQMAYGKNSKGNIVFKKAVYKKLTKAGKANFITYASKAGEKIMRSETIQKQYEKHYKKVKEVIIRKAKKQEKHLKKKGKFQKSMLLAKSDLKSNTSE